MPIALPLMEKQKLCKYSSCTGCAACAAICPMGCIVMQPDSESFLRPNINHSQCTSCYRCSATCPILQLGDVGEGSKDTMLPVSVVSVQSVANEKTLPLVYAAWHLDSSIRYESSSGGVFTALADNILADGGAVAGAAFDDLLVVRHIIIEKGAELQRLRGSKYVQSEISPAFLLKIHDMLEQGRKVLFSGTPCEVAGLRSFLRRPYENLFCCDLICHGVPSPMLFDRYVKNSMLKGNQVLGINFRDKTKGWNKFGVRQRLQDGRNKLFPANSDPYMTAFLKDYALRPSCYECQFKTTERLGDLTIADFWGVKEKYPEFDTDDKGTSLILVNNDKGGAWLNACHPSLFFGEADLNTAITGNPSLVRSSFRPRQRDTFYSDLHSMSFSRFERSYNLSSTYIERIVLKFKRLLISSLRRLMKSMPI